jgi:hypothetical protein
VHGVKDPREAGIVAHRIQPRNHFQARHLWRSRSERVLERIDDLVAPRDTSRT